MLADKEPEVEAQNNNMQHCLVTHHINVVALWGLTLVEISRKHFPESLSNLVLPQGR